MKPRFATSLTGFAASAVCLTLLATPAAHAYTWDITSGDNPAISDGSGNWNLTAGNLVWNNNANPNVIWSQTSATVGTQSAVFGSGTDGTVDQWTVTLGAGMAATSLTFNNTGYKITGNTLTLASASSGANNGSITVAAGKTATINSTLGYISNQPAAITVNSSATLNLGGGAGNSQYNFSGAGTVNMTAGTYTANTGSVGVAIFNQTGGTFNVTPGNNVGYSINSATQNVAYNLSAGTLTVNGNNTTASVNNSFLAIGNGTGSSTSTLNVSGSGTMNVGTTASRAGEIRIGNTNASNGTLNVSAGTVTVGTGSAANQIYFFKAGSGASRTASMTQSGGTVTTNGIQFGGSTGATTYDGTSAANLTLSGGTLYVGAQGITKGSDASTLSTTIRIEAGTLGADQNWSSSLDMQLGAATIRAQDAASAARNITLSGILSDISGQNGKITKTGAGTLTLGNAANTFTGQVLSDSGTIQVTKLANNGTASSLGMGTGSVRLGSNATATLEYIGATDSSTNKVIQIGTNTVDNTGNAAILNNGTGKLTFTATTFNQAVTGVTVARGLTLGGSYTGAANEIQGAIKDHNTGGGGIVSLTKTGASTWVLSGANTYTGATNVTGGVLAVNGSLANTTTTVGTGATLRGSGSIGGSVTVQSGGTIAAGNSIESLTIGALGLDGGSTFAYEANSDAAASVAGDLTAVTGDLTIDLSNTASLSLTELGAGSWSMGEKLTLISYSGTWNGGLFDFGGTLADDSNITFSGMQWVFNYNDTSSGTNYTGDLTGSRFVTMTAIPEPAAALLGGFGFLFLLRRRRP